MAANAHVSRSSLSIGADGRGGAAGRIGPDIQASIGLYGSQCHMDTLASPRAICAPMLAAGAKASS